MTEHKQVTIHTVKLTRSKRQGVAYGLDELGAAVRIWLLTPRAVEIGMERLEALGRNLGSDTKKVKARDANFPHSREWSLE
jgi:hypothetical protein